MKRDFLFSLVLFGIITILAMVLVIQTIQIDRLAQRVDSLETKIDLMTTTDTNLSEFANNQTRINVALLSMVGQPDAIE